MTDTTNTPPAQDDAAHYAELREDLRAFRRWSDEIVPFACYEDALFLVDRVDRQAQEIARLDTYRVQLCDCGSPVRQCTECAVGDYQAAAITTALIAKDEQMGADARLGAALREKWPTIDYALEVLEDDSRWEFAAKDAKRALAPLMEQAKDGAA